MVDAAQVRSLHDRAMELAQGAYMEPNPGNARELYEAAFLYERDAAELLVDSYDIEPTRSILYRSAASLAILCENPEEAERLARTGLSGNPPAGIANELQDILEKIHPPQASKRRAANR
ncbi:MAG TPA: hypothetical protein VL025_10450 [Thermoanaerobaculia bacterium]|nr:hypothetical protein [Thermoanaerobaculia bacterium]